MNRKLIRICSHIKWSRNKFGNVIIFNRLGKHKTVFINTTTGKEIWKLLTNKLYEPEAISWNDLLRRLCSLFVNDVSISVLNQDVELFLDGLLNENIISVTIIF